MSRRICLQCAFLLSLLGFIGCSFNYTSPPQHFDPVTGNNGDLFIRGTFDLPTADRDALFAHLRAYDRPLEIEAFAEAQKAQFFRSIHLGQIPYRGRQAWQFTLQQDANRNKCFVQRTWTLLGWLSADPRATQPKSGEKYSLFHLALEPCDDCPSGQFCRFGTSVRPHLNLTQVAP